LEQTFAHITRLSATLNLAGKNLRLMGGGKVHQDIEFTAATDYIPFDLFDGNDRDGSQDGCECIRSLGFKRPSEFH
jgi:hypothetical protein